MAQDKIRILTGIFALALTATFAGNTLANSRFTVQNQSAEELNINVFNGNDSICAAEAKHHHVDPGKEEGMGCEGGGKHRCKVRVNIKLDGNWEQGCVGLNNGCGDDTIILHNHATLVVGEGGKNCKIIEDEG